MAGPDTLQFTDQDFQSQVLQQDGLVVVDFWAPWCPPCRALAPAIDEVATRFADRAKIGKLDVDENPDAAARYAVSSIPTILFFNNGEQVGRITGLVSAAELEQKITALLGVGAGSA